MQIPDVPCLIDSSTCGVLDELDSAIVIDLYDPERTFVMWETMFSVPLLFYHNLVVHLVCMRKPLGVLSFIVMKDKLLLSFLEVLPVRLK